MVKKVIIITSVILLVTLFIVISIYNKGSEKSIKVEAEEINLGRISSSIESVGEIYPEIEKEMFFIYDVPLKINKVFFDKFDSVKKGDRIVEFEIPRYTTYSNKEKIKDMEKAPISGVITEINLKEDAYSDNMMPGVKITNVNDLYIIAKVKDSYIEKIKKDQPVKITSDAFGKDDYFEGRVMSIAPVASKSLGESGEEVTIDVKITVNEKSEKLKPGLKVNCEVTTEIKNDALIGKFEMIKQDKDNNKFVFIVDSKTKKLREEKIELGIISDMEFEIISGVIKGDMVVLDPAPSLKDGDLVEISKSSEV